MISLSIILFYLAYRASLIIFSASPSSGNRPSSFFENNRLSLTINSNTPPVEGIIVNSSMVFLCLFNKLAVRATALSTYPQDVQYSILILLITLPP